MSKEQERLEAIYTWDVDDVTERSVSKKWVAKHSKETGGDSRFGADLRARV